MIIAARFVVPVESPPIEDGAVQFENGVITAVGKRRHVSRKAGEELIDYGDAVILPGFVNAHTHLELTDLAGKVPPTPDFAGWLAALMKQSVDHPPTEGSVSAAVREGVRLSLAAGVTTVGDITRFPSWTRNILRDSGLSAVSFGEVIAVGKRRDMLTERLNTALQIDRLSSTRVGISPHSPYTVEPDALRRCAANASRLGLPICVHAAESREEAQFTRTGDGPLRNFLQSIDVWDNRIPVPGCSPIELLDRVGLLTPRTILAHANYVDDDDIALIAKSGASVAYCPRTHAAFGHPPHRFMDMLKAGINVCLGTDSLASNPSLSILDELRCLRSRFSIANSQLLHMATRGGASALGLAGMTGSLRPGSLGVALVVQPESAASLDTLNWEGTLHLVGGAT